MADQTTPINTPKDAEAAPERPSEAEKIRLELDSCKQEVQRLRDLLIEKDAELGEAKGRVTELTEHSTRFIFVAQRIKARVMQILLTAVAALRKRG